MKSNLFFIVCFHHFFSVPETPVDQSDAAILKKKLKKKKRRLKEEEEVRNRDVETEEPSSKKNATNKESKRSTGA